MREWISPQSPRGRAMREWISPQSPRGRVMREWISPQSSIGSIRRDRRYFGGAKEGADDVGMTPFVVDAVYQFSLMSGM